MGRMRRVPSVKKLMAAFKMPKDVAQQLHDKMQVASHGRDVARLLDAATPLLGGYGDHEVINPADPNYRGYWMGAALAYVNMGDPYVTTLYYDIEADTFGVGGWGDWLEAAERRGIHFS